jgi:hypothetical protein
MQSMDQSLMKHIKTRKISVNQAVMFAHDVEFFRKAG